MQASHIIVRGDFAQPAALWVEGKSSKKQQATTLGHYFFFNSSMPEFAFLALRDPSFVAIRANQSKTRTPAMAAFPHAELGVRPAIAYRLLNARLLNPPIWDILPNDRWFRCH